ncbi:MAG TPA: hypothetical protein PL041_13845 [Melioribacteraceae bacterium]|nr:hypothetical protein [Melioribacteraceae bacterium]
MEQSIISTALANGGISAILLVIWFFTVKYFSKQHEDTIKFSQDQFKQSLEQSSNNFEKALSQNQSAIDKLFTVLQEDIKYKEHIAEGYTKLENKIDKNRKELCN